MINPRNIGVVAKLGASKGVLLTKKFSPEILTAVGIVGGVTAAVLAARATLKLEETVETAQARIRNVKDLKEMAESKRGQQEGYEYDEKTYLKDLTAAHLHAAGDYIKLYGPSVSLGAASILSILAAHGIMQKRQVALVAAYKAVEESFQAYRKRVIEEYGEDKDRDFRLGLRDEEITDEETGKKVKVKSLDPNGRSMYAKFFDEYNVNWSKNPEYNLLFLKAQQDYANNRLQAFGYLFLNDVYESLGLPKTSAGSVVGWAITKDGDNFVDFDIYSMENGQNRRFVNGDEPSILLDFNVNGVIYDLIDEISDDRRSVTGRR